MNEEEILIVLKGQDKTKEIEYFSENNNGKITVKFYNKEQKYPYGKSNVIIKKNPEIIELRKKDIYYRNQILLNVKKVIRFEDFVKVIYLTNESQIFRYNDISLKSDSVENLNKNVIGYFKEISEYVKCEKEDEEKNNEQENGTFLKREYDKLNYINEESVLNYYINKIKLKNILDKENNIIYPFRFNLSQKMAMENVFKSNISVIQGPPGTGKTQTILNIIANLAIMKDKTVAVVSNNNEAVKNVKDKLKNKDMIL